MFELNGKALSVLDIVAVEKIQTVPGTRTIYGLIMTLKTTPAGTVTVWWDRSSGGVSEKAQRDAAYDGLIAEWKSVFPSATT